MGGIVPGLWYLCVDVVYGTASINLIFLSPYKKEHVHLKGYATWNGGDFSSHQVLLFQSHCCQH